MKDVSHISTAQTYLPQNIQAKKPISTEQLPQTQVVKPVANETNSNHDSNKAKKIDLYA